MSKNNSSIGTIILGIVLLGLIIYTLDYQKKTDSRLYHQESRIDTLQKVNVLLNKEILNKDSSIKELVSSKKSIQAENKSLSSDLQNKINELNDLKEEYDTYKNGNNSEITQLLKKKIDEKEETIRVIKDSLKFYSTKISELTDINKSSQKQIDSLNLILINERNKNVLMRTKIEEDSLINIVVQNSIINFSSIRLSSDFNGKEIINKINYGKKNVFTKRKKWIYSNIEIEISLQNSVNYKDYFFGLIIFDEENKRNINFLEKNPIEKGNLNDVLKFKFNGTKAKNVFINYQEKKSKNYTLRVVVFDKNNKIYHIPNANKRLFINGKNVTL